MTLASESARPPMSFDIVFTVLTPTHNRAQLITRAFESLCTQQGPSFEWLVVDDGSSDDTAAVVAACALRAPFSVRYLRQDHGHKKTAFNLGVRHAQGELLIVLDDDDELAPHTLARMWEAWNTIDSSVRSDYVGVTGLCARAGGRIVGDKFPQDTMDCTATRLFFEHAVRGEKFGCQRVDVLRRYPFPETIPGFVPESLVWWHIAADGYVTRFVNQVFRTYHATPTSLSTAGVSSAGHAPGLYLLSWSWIELQFANFRYAPTAFLMMAARLTRFRLLAHDIGMQHLIAQYPVTGRRARLLVTLMYPLGWLMYRRDRRPR